MLKKALARIRFKEMRSLLGVQELPSSTQKFRRVKFERLVGTCCTLWNWPMYYNANVAADENKVGIVFSEWMVKVLWGNYNFEYTISEAVGNSGGILCVWDPSVFRKEHHVVSDNFVALYGSWVSNQAKLLVVSIYAPQSITSKRSLWSYISSLISAVGDGHMYGLWGDFNEVICRWEGSFGFRVVQCARC
ncbi:RNA-directed DNA polymerase, eukaryota [Tanacetum coccineum]